METFHPPSWKAVYLFLPVNRIVVERQIREQRHTFHLKWISIRASTQTLNIYISLPSSQLLFVHVQFYCYCFSPWPANSDFWHPTDFSGIFVYIWGIEHCFCRVHKQTFWAISDPNQAYSAIWTIQEDIQIQLRIAASESLQCIAENSAVNVDSCWC